MRNNQGNKFKDYLELAKLKIMIPVSLTGFTGYFIFDPHLSVKIFITSFGILLLAISASVLNQIQEIDVDSMMDRTSHRPLPTNRIKLHNAALFSLLTLLAGIIAIYLAGNLKAVIIGLITIIWYNVIYTYSKKITAFAVVPGAVTGALPPLIGWVAAGGVIFEKPVIFLAFLIFIVQIPHFWLLVLKYGNEYKHAGLPSLTDVFTPKQIRRITFSWVISSVFAALSFAYFEIIQSQVITGLLLLASLFVIWQFSGLLKTRINNNYKKYSISLDLYFLLVLLLLISDRIIGNVN